MAVPSLRAEDLPHYRLYQEDRVKYYCFVDLETDCLVAFQLHGKLYQKDD